MELKQEGLEGLEVEGSGGGRCGFEEGNVGGAEMERVEEIGI